MTRTDRLLAWLMAAGVVLLSACLMVPAAKAQSVNKLCFPPANAVGNSCQDVTAANPLPVSTSISVSASVSGFTAATTGQPIAVTTGGATGTLPVGTVVVATNVGTTNAAYCALGASASTSSQYLSPAGGWFAFTVGASTQLTCVTATSTTTVNLTGGAGLPTGTGGGGGGTSGGGGAVTIADGADVTQGAIADAACATDNGTCSDIALTKRTNQRLTTINTTLGTPLQAGGTVGAVTSITNPVAVTGTFFQATQPVSGPLTDTQLRATAVPVSGTVTATGPLTDTQLRASAVPVSGTITANAGTNLNTSALALEAGNLATLVTDFGAPGATACATDTASCNLNQQMQRLAQRLTTINTTLGTPFQAAGSITNISGTISLPTGAATSANQTNASQKTQIVDGSGNVIAATSNNLNVQCANCSGSGVSAVDEASFTAGSSVFAAGGGFFQTTATSNALTTGQQGAFQVTANRALFTNLRNAAGTEIGTAGAPVRIDPTGTTAQTVSQATASSLNATVVGTGTFVTQSTLAAETTKVIGTVNIAAGQTIAVTNAGTFAVQATLSAETTKVIGTINIAAAQTLATVSTVTNLAQMNGAALLMGNGATGTGSQRVTIANDNTLPTGWASSVAQGSTTSGQTGPLTQCAVTTGSPTYTTAQTSPMSCDTAGNHRIAGAGTAGTASGGVLTVQGVASMTPILTTLSGTNNINTVTTVTTVATVTNLAQMNGAALLMGNGATGTGSQRVTIASDNTLPTGWASSVAQASTTSGQTGPLAQCAVLTSAPTYTTTQTNPLSCGTDGGLRVTVLNANSNGQAAMAASSPVVIASNQTSIPVTMTSTTITGSVAVTAAATTLVDITNVSTPITPATATATKGWLLGGQYNSSQATFTNGQQGALQVSSRGELKMNVMDAAGNARGQNVNANNAALIAIDQTTVGTTNGVSISQINSATALAGAGNTGTGSLRVTQATDQAALAAWGHVATGAAPPAGSTYVSGNGSGATGGLMRGQIICDLHAFYTGSDNGSKTLVAGVSGRKTYICGWLLSTGTTATTLTLFKGTDADCATSSAAIGPPYALLANDRVGVNVATWNGFVTATAADFVCINAGAGNAHTAEIWYAIL